MSRRFFSAFTTASRIVEWISASSVAIRRSGSKPITGGKVSPQQGGIMSHPSKDGVDKFMSHIQKAVNLRAEAERLAHRHWHIRVKGVELRKESEKMIRDAEYMVYELIDNAIGGCE
tara:strand:+ start:528 stop:878 length:351 start_codon:yes stop_codon:yes gene_type:complete